MPRAAPLLGSFNAGELSPNIEGRPDIAKYGAGAKTLENFIPLVQGPAKRRAASRFVAEVKTGSRAPDPTLPATRRQLLEYTFVFGVDRVLLVDAQAGVIRTVTFAT